MLDKLFNQLSLRFRNENNLSDIVWALCNISKNFKIVFLSFIFGDSEEFRKPFIIEREKTKNQTRPDFYFSIEGQDYIIENKIYDSNDHFQDYNKEFPNAIRGFISNYYIKKDNRFIIKTWGEFYSHLNECLNLSYFNYEEKKLIRALLKYLKNICYIVEVKSMNFNYISSLHSFITISDKVINSYDPSICKTYKNSFDATYYGIYFELNHSKYEKIIYPWFGIFFEDNPSISIGFENEYGNCDHLTILFSQNKFGEGKYYKTPYISDGVIWFEFKKNLFKKYFINNSSIEVKKQEKILEVYFCEVINKVLES